MSRLWILVAVALAGCTVDVKGTAKASPGATEAPASTAFAITSSDFAAGAAIPKASTCEGTNRLPAFTYVNVPAKASRVAMIVDDTDAPGGVFTHLVAWNMPTNDTQTAGSLPTGANQGNNDFGSLGYKGPCPKDGAVHHYHFRLYAVDLALSIQGGASRADLEAAIKGHIVGQTELIGTYKMGS